MGPVRPPNIHTHTHSKRHTHIHIHTFIYIEMNRLLSSPAVMPGLFDKGIKPYTYRDIVGREGK